MWDVLQFLSRPFVVGDRIDILTSGGTKFATGFVERVDPIYTVLRTDTGTPVTINNKVCPPRELNEASPLRSICDSSAYPKFSIIAFNPFTCFLTRGPGDS